MATKGKQSPIASALARVNAEANELFANMGQIVEKVSQGGAVDLDVIDVARKAGLEIDEAILDELQIDRRILCHPWLPWHCWWPWRPLWCWWWRRYHPWYRCCPWWWTRCHWWRY